jgi:hypothetical protein
MTTEHHPIPSDFCPWRDEDWEIAFMRRAFGDERVESMLERMGRFDRALHAKTMSWSRHFAAYRAMVTIPGCLRCQPTADACLVQRAHDSAVRHLEAHGEKLFDKDCETFRMAADVDLTTQVGAPCHLLWAQVLIDQSTEARRIAVNLDGHELWVTSDLDWENLTYLADNPHEPRYHEVFEFNVLAVDERVVPEEWLPTRDSATHSKR